MLKKVIIKKGEKLALIFHYKIPGYKCSIPNWKKTDQELVNNSAKGHPQEFSNP